MSYLVLVCSFVVSQYYMNDSTPKFPITYCEKFTLNSLNFPQFSLHFSVTGMKVSSSNYSFMLQGLKGIVPMTETCATALLLSPTQFQGSWTSMALRHHVTYLVYYNFGAFIITVFCRKYQIQIRVNIFAQNLCVVGKEIICGFHRENDANEAIFSLVSLLLSPGIGNFHFLHQEEFQTLVIQEETYWRFTLCCVQYQ